MTTPIDCRCYHCGLPIVTEQITLCAPCAEDARLEIQSMREARPHHAEDSVCPRCNGPMGERKDRCGNCGYRLPSCAPAAADIAGTIGTALALAAFAVLLMLV